MATAVIDLENVKAAVIGSLHTRTRRPTELLDALSVEYPESSIKEAVLRLLREGSIEMTPDRHLQETNREL